MITEQIRRSNGDFIPSNADKLAHWAQNISEYITPARATKWGIPPTTMTELREVKLVNFLNAQNALTNDSSRGMIAHRNETKSELVTLLRLIIRFYLRRPEVDDTDLIAMGIPPIDRIRTPRIVVTEEVDFVIHIHGIRRIIVDFWQKGVEHSKSKPRGYSGAELIWNIGKERPNEAKDFSRYTIASRRPFTIDFTEEDRGKTVWVALAWLNGRGIRGEWSEFKSAIIP